MQPVTYRCAACGTLVTRDEQPSEQGVPCPNCGQAILASVVPNSHDHFETAPPQPRFPGSEAPAHELASPDSNPHESHDFGEGISTQDFQPQPAGNGLPSQAGSPQDSVREVTENASFAYSAEIDSLGRTPREPRRATAISGWSTRTGMRSSLFIALVLIPLITYAVLATIAIITLYSRSQPEDLFERLPDLEGDYPGAKREKQGAISYDRLNPDLPLPARLKVALGETIQLGALVVTPQRVELRRIQIRYPGSGALAGIDTSLVLHLLLQNTSADLAFFPMDPYFERRWKDPSYGSKPYTLLEIDGTRLYGGPLIWKPGRTAKTRDRIEDQSYGALHPGETALTFLCTDPEDHAAKLLREHPAHLLWRVQVRRGLVRTAKGERSATAVLGVTFAASDIRRAEG